MSFCCFRPDLHVPLGGSLDMASHWVGALCTVLPAPGAARPTVMDRPLQVLFFGPSCRNGAGLCWGAGSTSTSLASSSTTTLVGKLSLEGSDNLQVHCYKLYHEPLNRGHELCNGVDIARHGCRQVCDSVERLLLEVPIAGCVVAFCVAL